MAGKNRFKTKIGGKEYTFIGDASDEHMETTARILNNQLAQLKNLSKGVSNEDAAILIAFNAISDQLKKQLELDKINNKAEDGED
ncbi:cell division protein ZapA [Fructilactobacillus fructivorans]|uniref:Cell division protein ZapA n=1 Tax=Fructilactobacillus fructivorans TaxID=1614 RepID=A0A0C1M5R6_9LACO|nr:cell division protein ZapA [Fructilactobacillus fructivorans]KID41549.1 Stimulator of FtsZ polymerization and component of cell-division Z-ring [Fructilactobacillus fructivorans]MCT0151200.1 cell division protein ZapA [Fructilactobacillus fructivorans]MCT2867723.1 cell division protein ZapA [Fructilactobacillus fructivorans]MCT2868759.1 cell division protein ZapA [Fructilactobacillus fructivorans]MCT2874071.1 cell division protein ZapA [Fructilactobacillus fructivorans]